MALDDIYASLELLEEQITELETELAAGEARNQTIMQNAVATAMVKAKAEAKVEARAEFKAELKAAKNQTPDLFSATWVAPVTVTKPSNDANSAILAKKLDSTIEKVQALLKEAGA